MSRLDALPTVVITDRASDQPFAALMAEFLYAHWPPADDVERLLALSELEARLEGAALPGVTVHWAPVRLETGP